MLQVSPIRVTRTDSDTNSRSSSQLLQCFDGRTSLTHRLYEAFDRAIINDSAIGDTALTGEKVLAEALVICQDPTKANPEIICPGSRHGRLLILAESDG